MPSRFFHVTAELVVSVVDAVVAHGDANEGQVCSFCGINSARAEQALGLATALGLLREAGGQYSSVLPLARFAAAPSERQKATMLRVVLECYEPFVKFRERLLATNSADQAASQTKQLLDLDADRDDIRETLVSLGTYTQAITSVGAGRYTIEQSAVNVDIHDFAAACADLAGAEAIVRKWVGPEADKVSREDVLVPLGRGLLKTRGGELRDVVGTVGNAVESFLAELARRMGVSLAGANGINSKLDKFRANDKLPKKIVEAAKYLGQVRNAAEHGIDTEVNAQWTILELTAKTYPAVACAFIRAALDHELNCAHSI